MGRHEDDAPNYDAGTEAFDAEREAIKWLAQNDPEFMADALREMGYTVEPPE